MSSWNSRFDYPSFSNPKLFYFLKNFQLKNFHYITQSLNRRPGIATNRIILDIQNDPDLECNSVEWSSPGGKTLNSLKRPITSHRTTFAKYEKERLFSEIDFAIEKSKILNERAGRSVNTGSELIEIECPEPITHRELTLPR